MQLRRFSLYANADKCRFFIEEVDFLGFIVGRNRICMDLEQVKTIAQ
jgi:hypothetical protein